MTLIATLLALLGERLLARFYVRGEPALIDRYVRLLRSLLPARPFWESAFALALVWGLPVLLVAWLQNRLAYPLEAVLFSGLILLLCLGPRDLADEVHRLLDARERGDGEGAERILRRLQRSPEDDTSPRSLIGSLFIQSHERLFGVLIWFFVFGPAGAVGYRLLSRLPALFHARGENPASEAADHLHGVAAWAPARVTAVLFGLAGSLDDALLAWRERARTPGHGWRRQTWAILAETASGSLATDSADGGLTVPASLDDTLREVLALQFRALLILLAFFAFFATGAWLR